LHEQLKSRIDNFQNPEILLYTIETSLSLYIAHAPVSKSIPATWRCDLFELAAFCV